MNGMNKISLTLVILALSSVPTATATDILQPVERPEGLDDRAEEVYGDEYKNISSWSCYELCVGTVTTEKQQINDIIYTLNRREGYVSEGEVVTNAPAGSLAELPMDGLIESGVVEKRVGDGRAATQYFKYTGDRGAPSEPTNAQVRERVRRRLYLTSTSMKAKPIAQNLSVGVDRVQGALQKLESDGKVDSGYDRYGIFDSYEWVDTRHGTLPDSHIRVLGPMLPVLTIVGVLGYVFHRRSQSPDADS